MEKQKRKPVSKTSLFQTYRNGGFKSVVCSYAAHSKRCSWEQNYFNSILLQIMAHKDPKVSFRENTPSSLISSARSRSVKHRSRTIDHSIQIMRRRYRDHDPYTFSRRNKQEKKTPCETDDIHPYSPENEMDQFHLKEIHRWRPRYINETI